MLIARDLKRLSVFVVACIALVLPATASAVGETATWVSPIDGLVVGGNAVNIVVTALPSSTIAANAEIVVDGGPVATGCDAGNTTMFPDLMDPMNGPVMISCIWDASAVAEGAHTLTARVSDGTPMLVSTTPINVTVDNLPPSGGSITVPIQDSTSTTANIGYVQGTDLHLSGLFMQRQEAPLVGGVCGTYDTFGTIGVDISGIASPYVDSGLATNMCYRYRLEDTDDAFNVAYYTSPNVVIVRAPGSPTPPTLSLALAGTGSGVMVSGSTVFYNPATPTGNSFSVTGTPGAGSGVTTNVIFPDVDGAGTGWTPAGITDTTAPYSTSYTYASGATSTGSQTVTVNDANTMSATASFTLTSDSAAPTGGSVTPTFTPPATATGTPSVSVAFSAGSDAGAGIASRKLQRIVGERISGDCRNFGALTDIAATLTTSPYIDTNVGEDGCYVYRLVVTDAVGNVADFDATSVVVVNLKRATVPGTSGNDRIEGTDDAEFVNLGAGNDVVRLGGGDDSASGGDGRDTIRGNLGDDCWLYGGRDADIIYGGPGNDCINGGPGDNALHGGSGADEVTGGINNDTITGGPGNDELIGYQGADQIGGGDGDDRVRGSHGDDVLLGNDGNDSIVGNQGRDRLFGGDGNDSLTGGLEYFDDLSGGRGDDTLAGAVISFEGTAPASFGLHGGQGDDVISLSWEVDGEDMKYYDERSTQVIAVPISCGTGADTVKLAIEKRTFAFDTSIQLSGCSGDSIVLRESEYISAVCRKVRSRFANNDVKLDVLKLAKIRGADDMKITLEGAACRPLTR